MQKILVIQTAFIGDVVLATGLLENLHQEWPDAAITILVRKGNESLFLNHPFLHAVWVWNKKQGKYRHLLKLLGMIRRNKFDLLITVQRFAATGFLAAFSKARRRIGFDKNPFSFLFSDVIRHVVSETGRPMHEIDRNHQLLKGITGGTAARPKLYPSQADADTVAAFKTKPYLCVAPASVWFTKQFPEEQWITFLDALPPKYTVYLLGAPGDHTLCDRILQQTANRSVTNLAGKLSFLQSAALQKDAVMNYVNDSAPMHFASSVNAPVAAIYCSTIPAFGFGPLSDKSYIIEAKETLACRPCGLHGRKTCPQTHFNCARFITSRQLLAVLPG